MNRSPYQSAVLALCAFVATLACGGTKTSTQPARSSAAPDVALAQPTPASTSTPSDPSHATNPVEPPSNSRAVLRALAYDPKDPLGDLEAADVLDRAGADPKIAPSAGAAETRCVPLEAATRVWPEEAPPAITSAGDDFVIAGYDASTEPHRVFVVRVARGKRPDPIATLIVQPSPDKPRKVAPGLDARDRSDVTVAFVDAANHLLVQRLRLGHAGHGAPIELATKVDPRFSPALTHHRDYTLVAWTTASTPMHTWVASISADDAVQARSDITPTSMGASAPTFVANASPPELIAIDARSGVSTLLRVALSAEGKPGPAVVARPVSMVATPPALTAVADAQTTYVAYTGVGAAATSAIGLVDLARPTDPPRAVVRGTGYGPLHVASTPTPHGAIIASDAPGAASGKEAREVHVQLMSGGELGAPLRLAPQSGAAYPAVALASNGTTAVAYTNEAGVYVSYLRCEQSPLPKTPRNRAATP